jgi:glycosyltransferase involved in cell wall biosynthesis
MSLTDFDGVICMSHRMASEVRRKFPRAEVSVLTDPIDLELFRKVERQEARRLLNLDPGKRYVVFTSVDAENPLKRTDLAREAVRLAARSVDGCELLIASGVPRAEMPLHFSAADVALCTSVAEGWPNCIKEALACGIPFVSTDVSDLATLANLNPACQVVEADPQALCDALLRSLGSEPDDLESLVRSMSLDAYGPALASVYQWHLERCHAAVKPTRTSD